MNLRNIYYKTKEMLEDVGVKEADSESFCILEDIYKCSKSDILLNVEVDFFAEEKIKSIVEKRRNNVPLQQILGYAHFYGNKFFVNENVLIPRFDTEILVEKLISHINKEKRKLDVLDMCTGSGIIGITLSLFTNANILISDISKEALFVAKKNVENLCAKNISINCGNLFENVEGTFDIIVSNPPYISIEEKENLSKEVLHDPALALFASDNGLYFYKKIVENAKKYLKEDGYLFFEIGHNQGNDVKRILEKNDFSNISLMKDYNNLDRVIFAKRGFKWIFFQNSKEFLQDMTT